MMSVEASYKEITYPKKVGFRVSPYLHYYTNMIYNNWYKCYIYMEGNQRRRTHRRIIRELEYYEN